MNGFRPPPALRLFRGHAGVIEPYLIEEVTVAIGASSPCCRGDGIDDGSKIALGRLLSLLRLLSILDVYIRSVPFDDVARIISLRIRADKKASICAVESAHTYFNIPRCPRSQTRPPIFDECLTVARMNGFRPSPALRLFRGHSHVLKPYLIHEVAIAIRTSSPCGGGDRTDDGGVIALARPQSLFRTGVGDSERGLIRKQT